MDGSTVVLAISAIIGPVVAVFAAHRMGQQENKRLEAGKLLRQLSENCQSYYHALERLYRGSQEWQGMESEVVTFQEDLKETTHTPRIRVIEQQKLTGLKIRLDYLGKQKDREMREVESTQSALFADTVSLKLLFGKQSDACVNAIEDLVGISTLAVAKEPPEQEAFLSEASIRVGRVIHAIRPLYESLTRSTSCCDEC